MSNLLTPSSIRSILRALDDFLKVHKASELTPDTILNKNNRNFRLGHFVQEILATDQPNALLREALSELKKRGVTKDSFSQAKPKSIPQKQKVYSNSTSRKPRTKSVINKVNKQLGETTENLPQHLEECRNSYVHWVRNTKPGVGEHEVAQKIRLLAKLHKDRDEFPTPIAIGNMTVSTTRFLEVVRTLFNNGDLDRSSFQPQGRLLDRLNKERDFLTSVRSNPSEPPYYAPRAEIHKSPPSIQL